MVGTEKMASATASAPSTAGQCFGRLLSNMERSEERRVGKECRSRCDWSSDVCSSDLLGPQPDGRDGEDGKRDSKCSQYGWPVLWAFAFEHGKIGRASCRERV